MPEGAPCAKARVHLIAAVRPNIVKIAPLWRALAAADDFAPILILAGQHYDRSMAGGIWDELGLPEPHHRLEIGSDTHAGQIGRAMAGYEALALVERPDWLVVPGDVNAGLGCAIAGARLGVPLVHLEAGLRSGDRTMPEEQNRILIDALADVLWTPSPDADANLAREGAPPGRITRVGNIMIDTLAAAHADIAAAGSASRLGFARRGYAVATLHRPSNVDDAAALAGLVSALCTAQAKLPVILPAHPRLARRLRETGLDERLTGAGVRLVEPLSYIAFMSLVADAALAITDSGGLQEETTVLGIPCLTLREATERPITISGGTNRLVSPEGLGAAIDDVLAAPPAPAGPPALWDGRTAERCVADLRHRQVLSRAAAPISP